MKRKLILKLVLIFGPFVAGLLWLEYRLGQVETSYALKWKHFNAQASETEILILGSSLGYYGIDPALFTECKGYNMAEHAQTYYYDVQILKHARGKFPKLKLVILPIVYSQMGTDGTDNDPWRAWFYSLFYGIAPETHGAWEWLKARLDPAYFSKIALFGDRTKVIMSNGFKLSDEHVLETGFHPAPPAPAVISPNEILKAKGAAEHHNTKGHFAHNEKLIQEVIDLSKGMGAEVIFVEVPMSPLYADFIDPAHYARMQETLTSLKTRNQVKHFNYLKDKRFTQDDYTLPVDHLNYRGADKFTRILNKEVLSEVLKGKCGKSS